ncbi:hypothetical protein [Candidatus Bathycorpusculum sp.]|uniref:hypothetical protein n=1 Tax=Candidatus Bathycorpusculum sp. TaxID=2994959 RepID=UPI002835293A|nr:hypothetical protein [Candidatus Termitimicrobium sp.]MCL2685904.1 hypothetical protein [Candidatus Termitimicrobium sp.]
MGTTTKKKGFPVEKVVGFLLVVLVFGILLWQAQGLISLFGDSKSSETEYTTLSLVPGISKTYQHNSDNFVFSYKLSDTDTSNLLYVTKNAVEQTGSYPAVAGATYSDLGLEMKLGSVSSNVLVLQVKPLSK